MRFRRRTPMPGKRAWKREAGSWQRLAEVRYAESDHWLTEWFRTRAERDNAREVAVHLENENRRLTDALRLLGWVDVEVED